MVSEMIVANLGITLWTIILVSARAADVEGFEDQYYFGRRANGMYIPRYRNIGKDKRDYIRGFGYQGGASRQGWASHGEGTEYRRCLKEAVSKPGKWTIGMGGFGEILPYHDNKVTINKDKKDKYGLPTLTFDAILRDNELKMRKDMANDAAEMLEAGGFKNVKNL